MSSNHEVIRHGYENVLTACARLASFASGRPTDAIDGLINGRQTLLAADDLIVFAVSGRRLMDNAASLGQFIQTNIKVIADGIAAEKPVTRVVNIIIHHKNIRIARFNHDLVDLTDPKNWTAEYFAHKNVKHFPPIVVVRSDQGGPIAFGLWDLITTFELGVIAPIVDACADDGLYLDDITQ